MSATTITAMRTPYLNFLLFFNSTKLNLSDTVVRAAKKELSFKDNREVSFNDLC